MQTSADVQDLGNLVPNRNQYISRNLKKIEGKGRNHTIIWAEKEKKLREIKKEMGKKTKTFWVMIMYVSIWLCMYWVKFMYVSLYLVDDDSEGWVLLVWVTFFTHKRKKSTIK